MTFYILFLFIVNAYFSTDAAVVKSDEIEEQGLYRKSDNVVILGYQNFEKYIYGRDHSWLVQFYNSYCGHCKAFSPKFKTLASDIEHWKDILRLAVVDCSVEENNEICRQFEVMAYPSLRYLHENYVKGNTNIGDRLFVTDTADKLKTQIITKLQNEQSLGRLNHAPSLSIASYSSLTNALSDVPNDVIYTFFIFENENSTIGSEIILNTNDYKNIRVKRAFENCELAELGEVKHFPGLAAVRSNLEVTALTPKNPTGSSILNAINTFLKSKNYVFPPRDISNHNSTLITDELNKFNVINDDIVFLSDLEKTVRTSLHTEITRFKSLKGEALKSLIDYLDILVKVFPFKANGKAYMTNLRNTVMTQTEWSGNDLYNLVLRLEELYTPVYSSKLEYVACRGFEPKYRGYTCGLWTLFHTLTVNAVNLPGFEGPNVLKVMHNYVKYFFGCTECSQHFQEMAARNHIFGVKDNDKAVLWLWISHNEVNLRIAGDITEDPEHPKIQFPSVERCPDCRLSRGAWNLSAVYRYLQNMYNAENIRYVSAQRTVSSSPLTDLDIGMLSLLYMQA